VKEVNLVESLGINFFIFREKRKGVLITGKDCVVKDGPIWNP